MERDETLAIDLAMEAKVAMGLVASPLIACLAKKPTPDLEGR
jgi:hypothetical protein